MLSLRDIQQIECILITLLGLLQVILFFFYLIERMKRGWAFEVFWLTKVIIQKSDNLYLPISAWTPLVDAIAFIELGLLVRM